MLRNGTLLCKPPSAFSNTWRELFGLSGRVIKKIHSEIRCFSLFVRASQQCESFTSLCCRGFITRSTKWWIFFAKQKIRNRKRTSVMAILKGFFAWIRFPFIVCFAFFVTLTENAILYGPGTVIVGDLFQSNGHSAIVKERMRFRFRVMDK